MFSCFPQFLLFNTIAPSVIPGDQLQSVDYFQYLIKNSTKPSMIRGDKECKQVITHN